MDPRIRALYKIDPDSEGPAVARRIVAEELSDRVPDRVLEDVQLMVSELVTNGIVHGSTQDDGPVMLDLYINGAIRCRVLDHGARFARRFRHERDADAGGWGLQVVEQLSDLWGMECSPQRTEVWFVRECA
ncbi:MAG: ATP-binding protein [Solirubrobacterales bacterium]|nr:ATP-binding protein [Solirubrobacterales bacterium]